MIGKMFSSLRQYNYGGLVPFYDAVVIPKEGDAAIFAGYHVSLNSAKSYIDKTYPGKYYVTYQKIYLSDEPSVMEVNGVELK